MYGLFYCFGRFYDQKREGWSSSGLYVFPQEQLKHFLDQEWKKHLKLFLFIDSIRYRSQLTEGFKPVWVESTHFECWNRRAKYNSKWIVSTSPGFKGFLPEELSIDQNCQNPLSSSRQKSQLPSDPWANQPPMGVLFVPTLRPHGWAPRDPGLLVMGRNKKSPYGREFMDSSSW